MSKVNKVEGTAEAWDSRDLGATEQHVRPSNSVTGDVLDDAMGLQMISIRLERELITLLKTIAKIHGVGYQPLIRDQLHRFASAEAKRLVLQNAESLFPKGTEETAPDEDCPPEKMACAM